MPNLSSKLMIVLFMTSIALFMIVYATPASMAADTSGTVGNIERDCFWQLTKGKNDRIKCDFPVRMTPNELKKVTELTRGVLKDAHCNMVVDIDRKLVLDAMHSPDHIFEPPPQPVTCQVNTTKKDFPLSFFFRPRVVFKDGIAVKATPGMGAETRATRVISWPVRKWVNTSNEIEDAMVRIVNAYMKQYRK